MTPADLRRRLFPDNIAARFTLLLTVVLIAANLIAALLLAQEGSALDRRVRIQGDLGRLVALVTALERVDISAAQDILRQSSTGFTRFAVAATPIGPMDAPTDPEIERVISAALPAHEIRVLDGESGSTGDSRPILSLVSVRLTDGVHAGDWLTSLIYPLPSRTAWEWKSGFFVPLIVSLAAALAVGWISIRRMTQPLRNLADAARSAGFGDRSVRVSETGAREIREMAVAFNDMQRRIENHEAERTRMLAALGHDLRTPITSLRMRSEMLDSADLREPMLRTLAEMTVMAEDLLRFGKAGQIAETQQDLDLSRFLGQLCADRNVPLAAAEPLRARIRPVAMTRAIGNLIDNALRYAGSASVSLHRAGDEIVIAVQDDGPGIDPARVDDIVEPFVRGEASRSQETGGAGLGLSITRSIVLAHAGSLILSNRASGGLRAEIRLPRQALPSKP